MQHQDHGNLVGRVHVERRQGRVVVHAVVDVRLQVLGCDIYTYYPCPKKLDELPAVLFRYANVLYKLYWAWAWV